MSEHIQNSLTAPADRVPNPEKISYNLGVSLTEADVKTAMSELNVNTFVNRFPKVEKFYADPLINGQIYSLVSFLPSKGATPDKDGVFGMLKVRGTFATEDEAMLRAEYLVRNVDSYHSIYHTYVGRPFPLAATGKYISETVEIDIKKKVTEETSAQIRQKRDAERQTIKDIEEKEKELLEDVAKKPEEIDPIDTYTEMRVKKAQLSWTYLETLKKMNEMRENIIKTRKELVRMDVENPECRGEYLTRYKDARKKSGLPETDESFMKYLGDDLEADLGF
uniref:Uncharacterized protein n=1 Tax=viral metagenome TaxID=1070528 RepID=A0A6C0KCR4_9ZZZZ